MHSKFDNWQAPKNYHLVDSAIEGITVFAPIAESNINQNETIKTYICPQCGASTKYDITAGGIACEYCGYSTSTISNKVGQNAKQFEFTLETLNKEEIGWGVNRLELFCDNCGASLAIEDRALTVTCPFCASNKVLVRQYTTDNLRPQFIIPFTILSDSCQSLAKEWLGKGWFHPKILSHSSIIERFIGIYLSFWTFTSHISSQWQAQVGYVRTESYHINGELRTRTIVDWRWKNGQVDVSIPDLLISGNSHFNQAILDRLHPYNLSDLVVYSPDFLVGWQALSYNIPLSQAWETGKAIMREKVKEACYLKINSQHIRNFSMNADFSDESWRLILLPIYLASYKYEDKIFQIMINGQTSKVVGQKPVDWWKIWLAIAALLLPGILCTIIGLIFIPVLPFSLILLILGAVFSIKLYKQGIESEAT